MSIRKEWAERNSSSANDVAALRGRLIEVAGAPEDIAPEGAAVLWLPEELRGDDFDGIIYCPGDAPTALKIQRGERPGRILRQLARAFERNPGHNEPREIFWSEAIDFDPQA